MPRDSYPTLPDDPDVLSVLMQQMSLPVEQSLLLASTCKNLIASVLPVLHSFPGTTHLWSDNVGKIQHVYKHSPNVTEVIIHRFRDFEIYVGDQLQFVHHMARFEHLTGLTMPNVGLCFNAVVLIHALLKDLTYVDVSYNQIGMKGKALLVQMPHMEELLVDYDSCCSLLWARALNVEMSSTLRRLHLDGLMITNRNFSLQSCSDMLRRIGALRHLRELHLSSSMKDSSILTSSVYEHLVALPLERLTLAYANLFDRDALVLSRISTLRMLDVSWNNLTLEGIRALCRLERLSSLHIARLFDSGLGKLDVVLSSLSLTQLDVSHNVFHPNGAYGSAGDSVLHDPCFEAPRYLGATVDTVDMSYCDLHQVHFTPLMALPNITSLDVSNSHLGERGAGTIAALQKLRILKCKNCCLELKDLRCLSTLPLTTLDMSYHACRFSCSAEVELAPISSLQHLSMKDLPFPLVSSLPSGASPRRCDDTFPSGWIASMSQLVSLDIDCTCAELAHVSEIAKLPLLEVLSMSQLRCCQSKAMIYVGEDTDADLMVYKIVEMPRLRHLDISLNNVRRASKILRACKKLIRCRW